MNKYILILIITIFTIFLVFPEDKVKSQDLYNMSLEKYNKNDIDGALNDLKQSIDLDNRNFKAIKFYADLLNIKGKKLIDDKKFNEAFDVYKEAYKIYPSNKEISENYKGLKDGTIQKGVSKNTQDNTSDTSAKNEKVTESKVDNELMQKLKDAEQKLASLTTTKNNDAQIISDESKKANEALLKEINEQKKLIDNLKKNYETINTSMKSNNVNTSNKDTQMINELLKTYKVIIDSNNKVNNKDTNLITEQLKQQRLLIENQNTNNRNIILIFIGSICLIILLIIFLFLLFFILIRNRIKKNKKNDPLYYGFNPSQIGQMQAQMIDSGNSLLLGYDANNSNENKIEKKFENEEEMYKDLIKLEKLKRMHNQMKNGELNWQVVRENIHEMEKDLKVGILNLVEIKLMNGEITDYSYVLPVLFPYLTDGDDYLKHKANNLIKSHFYSKENKLLIQSNKDDSVFIEHKNTDDQDIDDMTNINNLYKYLDELQIIFGRKENTLNTAKIAKGISLSLNMAKGDIDLLFKTTIAHDFGFLLMDKERLQDIMYKTDITDEDYEFIKKHAKKGIEFFKSSNIPQEMKDGILYHHERNDGSGYPENLKGDSIPQFSKIIGVAETFVSLTTNRPHKEKLSIESALAIIKDGSKRKFDVIYINALSDYLKKAGIIKG